MISVENCGLVNYKEAMDMQMTLVEKVASGGPERFIVCSHPAVVTCGRGTRSGDIFGWKGDLVDVTRGGRATYHGPSQIIIYPILNLNFVRRRFKARDLHAYLRGLENALVAALTDLGLAAEAKTIPQDDGPSLTGVWVGERKIASIGIAVRKWVTYHGIALNYEDDPKAFQGINPCGFQSTIMTNVLRECNLLGQKACDRKILENLLILKMQEEFAPLLIA